MISQPKNGFCKSSLFLPIKIDFVFYDKSRGHRRSSAVCLVLLVLSLSCRFVLRCWAVWVDQRCGAGEGMQQIMYYVVYSIKWYEYVVLKSDGSFILVWLVVDESHSSFVFHISFVKSAYGLNNSSL